MVVAGSCLAAIAVVAVAVAKKWQRDKQRSAPLNKPLLEESGDSELLVLRDTAKFDIETGAPTNTAAQRLCMLQWVAGEPESVRELPYVDIEAAAGQFGPANQLASGGSCTVFRGNLYGLDVAIKQLHTDADEWNNTQFETEMRLLCTVTHENICELLAFSADGPQRCIVLELCTGALDTRLACTAVGDGPPPQPLTWHERLGIAVGIASALVHLHSRCPQMLHRDLKTANVLLDAANKAKVADFGTAREGPTDNGDTHVVTQRRVGTRIYMPHEYTESGHVSEKTDSYAFGVILLELVTASGPRAVVGMMMDDAEFFSTLHQHKDARAGGWPTKAVSGLASAAARCTEFRARNRAKVSDVLPKLLVLAKLKR